MGKVFWLDTETTGLNPRINDIIQLAALIEIDGAVESEINIRMAPINIDAIDPGASKVHGITVEAMLNYRPAAEGFHKLIAMMKPYVNPYNSADKFIVAGYWVRHDTDFLRQLFEKMGDKYYGSWFASPAIDVATTVAEYLCSPVKNEHDPEGLNFSLPNYKLKTICHDLDIKYEEHDALEDITATREVYNQLKEYSG